MPIDAIIKFGGSVVTKKHAAVPEVDEACITALAAALRSWLQDHSDSRICLVHGAGSFGHPQAKQYRIAEGRVHPDWCLGAAAVRSAVGGLCERVAAALVAVGLPVVAVPVWGVWQTAGGGRSGRVVRDNVEQIQSLAEQGWIPLLHGDVVLDTEQGVAILSGDTIIAHLCSRPPAIRTVLFLTDVDGVYDRDPREAGARRVAEVRVSGGEFRCLLEGSSPTESLTSVDKGPAFSVPGTDVTGAMATKFQAALLATQTGAFVFIANAANPQWPALLQATTAQPRCTLVRPTPGVGPPG